MNELLKCMITIIVTLACCVVAGYAGTYGIFSLFTREIRHQKDVKKIKELRQQVKEWEKRYESVEKAIAKSLENIKKEHAKTEKENRQLASKLKTLQGRAK